MQKLPLFSPKTAAKFWAILLFDQKENFQKDAVLLSILGKECLYKNEM